MKNVLITPATYGTHGITRRAGMLTLLGGALALAGCGGGGDGLAAVGTGGTGSFSVGPITGFGSIIVNGVRFEDSLASVSDDDGNDMRGKLMLGMVVRVKGGKLKSDGSADADTIEARSELLGPIDSIDLPANTLLVFGQTVQITATTIFEEGLAGISALSKDNIVEVHGFVDPVNNRLTATRIERKALINVKAFKLQGAVSTLAATTFQIGALTISFALPVDMPASLSLANGMQVRVRIATNPLTGVRTALKIRAVDELEIKNCDETEVEGLVTSIDPTNSKKFSVNGLPVDASSVTVPTDLRVGVRVEVEGSLVNGVLVAKKVELEDENDQLKFELHGTITAGSLNTTTFVLHGVTVGYTTTQFENGGVANLIDGKSIEVKGIASTDGTKVIATRIKFES